MRTLDADDDVVIAAMLQPLLDAGYLEAGAAQRFGAEPLRLALRLANWASSACRRTGRPNAASKRRRLKRCAKCCWR